MSRVSVGVANRDGRDGSPDEMETVLKVSRLAMWGLMSAASLSPGHAEGRCLRQPATVYVGAIIGADQLADPRATAAIRDSHAASFYLTSYALTQVQGLDLPAIQTTWRDRAPGIIEVGTDPRTMPDIARSFSSYIKPQNGWTWGPTKGTAWPEILAGARWSPTIAMLNAFVMGTQDRRDDPYYLMNTAAIADVRARARSIRYVLPYLTPNISTISRENGNAAWAGTYWGESRALAEVAGGLGLDTPANYFVHVREQAYRDLVVQEIRWARENSLISEVLLSPYDMKAAPGTTPQVQFDPGFAEAVRDETRYLHAHGADPTIYVVTNYSEAPTNEPGRAAGDETIDATALWLTRNASVSPWPTACR